VAVAEKIAEQKHFVAEWDRQLVPVSQKNTSGGAIPIAEPTITQCGISQQTVSRWRTTFADPKATLIATWVSRRQQTSCFMVDWTPQPELRTYRGTRPLKV
jgi:hypothetical protein